MRESFFMYYPLAQTGRRARSSELALRMALAKRLSEMPGEGERRALDHYG